MIFKEKPPIVVVGAGYVGLVTAVAFAKARQVRLVDIDEDLITDLKAGRMPIYEEHLQRRFDEVRGRLTFTTKLDEALADRRAQLVFIAVGTPPSTSPAPNGAEELPEDPDGELPPDLEEPEASKAADLEAVDNVIGELLPYGGLAVVMRSTVPPGTGEAVLQRARDNESNLVYLSCPEFLQEGTAFECVDKPDRIVVGRNRHSWATRALRDLHAEVHPKLRRRLRAPSPKYLEMGIKSAELVKLQANVHLAMRVSYVNEMASICEEHDADAIEVMGGVGVDHRIGPEFLEPGVGFGGSCFDKDVRSLWSVAEEAQVDTFLPEAILKINKSQAARVVSKLERHLGDLEGRRIAILGLAFKPGTDDLRGSPAFRLAGELRRKGAVVRAWDPRHSACERAVENSKRGKGKEWITSEELAGSAVDAMTEADAVVLVTAWPEIKAIDWNEAARVLNGTLVVDGRNMLSPQSVRAAGLEYEGTGRESLGLGRPLPERAGEA